MGVVPKENSVCIEYWMIEVAKTLLLKFNANCAKLCKNNMAERGELFSCTLIP